MSAEGMHKNYGGRMENGYKVVFGGLREGVDPEQFVRAFAQMFKVPEEQARKLVSAGRPVALKDNLDQATAEKYRGVLEKLGVVVRLEHKEQGGLSLVADEDHVAAPPPEQPKAPEPEPASAPTPTPSAAPAGARCPKCGSDRVQGDDCLACGVIIPRYLAKQARLAAEGVEPQNPYAAPQSDVAPVHDVEESEMTGPHKVPAGNGWQWIVGGWHHFQGNPLAWIGAIVVWYIITLAANFVPFVGPIVVGLFTPVIFAGFMLGADEQREGGSFGIRHLFAGFSANSGKLVQVGLLYLLYMILVFGGAGIVAALSGMGGLMHAHGGHPDPRMEATMMGPILLIMLTAMLLSIPVIMAYWFAPALVVFEDLGPLEAMKLSFKACLKNILAFLVYGLIAIGLSFVAVIPVGLGMLVLIPVMIAAMYVSYRDIFYEQAG